MEKDMAVIRLLFTRHGETEENNKGIICGQQPGTLTKLGKEQAKKIGTYLFKQNSQFDHIYVSDLGRTVDTFQNIKSQAKQLEKIPVTITALLREKSGGVLEGRPLTSWKQEADKEKKTIRQYKCAKAESWMDVNKRCLSFLTTLIETHVLKQKQLKPQSQIKIFAVAHGGVLMQFHNVVRWLSLKQQPIFKNTAKNCSLHEFVIEYPLGQPDYDQKKVRIKCVKQNFIDHLK